VVLADIWPTWPGLNTAFLLSLAATVVMILAIIPLAKRRPIGTPLSWGEAMVATVYAFLVMFLAYGVVPHQWLTHADNELGWRTDKLVFGPWDIVEKYVPFTVTFEAIRDVIASLIYIVFLGLQIYLWVWWQRRGQKKAPPELPASTFGRPLVRRG
jgi:hypothetical protein